MKNVIITGGNGMMGNLILQHCLQSSEIARVTCILRRSTGIVHPKLTEVLHNDFMDYSAIETAFRGQDICYFCIGVYTGQVPKDAFTRITVDYTRVFAQTLHRHSPQASFCFLSGDGADRREKSPILFARTKGMAENILFNTGFAQAYTFRPGYIYPVTPRQEPNFLYKFMRLLYKPFFSIIYPNIGLSSAQLAQAMFHIGLRGGEKQVYENRDIRRYAVK
jgi:uncharacterized protein YbjT (DUF2867 family)